MTCASPHVDSCDKTITVSQAKKLIEQVEFEQMKAGETWCLIVHKWWMKFLELKDNLNDSDVLKLPPISNEEITFKKRDGTYELKPHLYEVKDYILVPEKIFCLFQEAYGVEILERDIIKRTVIEGSLMERRLFIEIYPIEIKVAQYNKKDQIINLKISQSESIAEIKKKVLDALRIEERLRNSVKFIVEDNGVFEILPSSITHVKLGSLLNADSVIYVSEDGILSDTSQRSTSDVNGNNRRIVPYSPTPFQREQLTQPGLCGLHNLGNTCFMNSALQCLSNVPELTDYFLSNRHLKEINETNVLGTGGKLGRAYGEMIQEMWSGSSTTVRPNKLKAVIGTFAPRFNGYAQQDSQELTSFLLDGLHEDLNRIYDKPYIEEKEGNGRPDTVVANEAWQDYKKRNDSIIVDLMHGQLKSTLVCPICEKVSVKFDPFCFLSVPVPSKERQTRSTITFVRKSKWAKFVITHTNKATSTQAVKAIKNNLKLDLSTRIVLLPHYSSEIIKEDGIITSATQQYSNYSSTKNFYAYAVKAGPLVIVENKTNSSFDRTLGVPLVLNLPENRRVSVAFVHTQILPVIREFLCQQNSTSAEETSADESISGENNENIENKNDFKKPVENEDPQLPADIIVSFEGNQYKLSEMDNLEVEIPETCTTPVKILIKWAVSSAFKQINLDSLVDREINLASEMKKFYSLDECVESYLIQEQLGENDSWYCPSCKKHQRAFKKLDLWALPKILIVHLKRFQYSRYNRDKIDTDISIPTRGLDLTDKIVNPSHKQHKYDLIAISNHSGGLGSGHYTARAWNNNRWCDFNDSVAYASTDTLPETFTSREAYILYYRRRDLCPTLPQMSSSSTSLRTSSRLAAAANGTTRNSSTSTSNGASSSTSPSKRRVSESSQTKMDVD